MVYLDTMPLRFGHFRVLITTAMGQFLGAAVATLSGVLIPLLAIVQHHELDSVTQGLIASMELIGIMVGSFVIGKLADKDGYLPFLRLSSILVFIGALVVYVSGSIDLLIPSLFVMGFGIGGDFALDSDYVDEVMPKRWQETMVGITKSFSALGNLSAAGGFLFLCSIEWAAEIWRQIFLFVVFLSFLMIISRLFFFKSPGFLIAKGKFDEARQVVKAMLGSDVEIPSSYLEKSAPASNGAKVDLFKGENLQKVIFSGVPWGCSGLGVYGIGIFLPILIMSLGISGFDTSKPGPLGSVMNSVNLTFIISWFILIGFIAGLFILHKVSTVKQQFYGFLLAAAAVLLLLLCYLFKWPAAISIAAFVLFELALNAGPNLTTFIIPSLVFPLDIKAEGAGYAAFFGKLGAVIAVFCFPILMKLGGVSLTLATSVAVLGLGAFLTYYYAKKLGLEK